MKRNSHNGFAIAIAWPETLCKQAGAWYDGLMSFLKFSQNNYYKVGHAAIILIPQEGEECHYFDFGRYHSPYGHGRVRDAETDHDLAIKTPAKTEGETLVNFEEILAEILGNPSCHGTGKIYASYCAVNFEKSYQKAKGMQEVSPFKYGPFLPKGTNCSRFVRTVVLAGKPKLGHSLKLIAPYSLSPSPKTNVDALTNKLTLFPNEEMNANSLVL
jgi:hypothetical protein